MAKGDGGGGHFDERRRAAAAKPKPTYKADSPEVLSAIQKPKAKPVVVTKKKRVAMPMAKPRRLADINLGGPKPSLKYRDIVNREAKADPFYGDIVNRTAKADLGGQMPNSYASTKGDRQLNMYNGSLLGFLNDHNYNPFPTGRLTNIQEASNEAAAGENEGYGILKRNQRY